MPDDPYTLGDLARLADVTPRTVRYYVAQGLLPSPAAAGPATRYGEGHLARLRLIRRLQREHLPLAEIRLRLERMGDDEVVASVQALTDAEPEPSRAPDDTLAYVRSLMAGSGIRPSVPNRGSGGVRLARMAVADSLDPAWPVADESSAPAPAAAAPSPPASAAQAPSAASVSMRSAVSSARIGALSPKGADVPAAMPVTDRSTWERLVITPDIELHVRRPLDRAGNKRVEQLTRIARELFDQD